MGSEQSRDTRFFHGLSQVFRRKGEGREARTGGAPDFGSAATQLDSRLKQLAEKLDERRREEERAQAISSGRVDPAAGQADRAKIREARAAGVHGQIRRDIIACHSRLSTGIDAAELEALHAFMLEMREMAASKPGDAMDARIRGAIVRRLFQETAQVAWERLLGLMAEKGEQWPGADESARQAEEAAAAEVFLQGGLPRSADLVVGIVESWRDHYPGQTTALWRSVCLRAVATGLRAAMLREMVEAVKANAGELRAEGERLLEGEVAAVQGVLDAGVNSIEDADKVMSGASELLERVLPELCWEHVKHLRAATPATA